MKILYASDLDRTLIYSYRFLDEHKSDANRTLVETGKDGKEISYMADSVMDKLARISSDNNGDITFVPVTTRSIEQYERIKLGFTPEWAITSNGGVILHKEEQVKEYSDYVVKLINPIEVMQLIMDFGEFESVDYKPVFIDNRYIFLKTINEELFDLEVEHIRGNFTGWDFVRQRNKCYAIPVHFSKQVALRWLWHKLGKPTIVASGDSKLDLPMLTLADRVFIPDHASLLSEGTVEKASLVHGGIESPLETISVVEKLASEA